MQETMEETQFRNLSFDKVLKITLKLGSLTKIVTRIKVVP